MGSEDNKKLGYVPLYRSMLKWEWFQDRNTLQVFIYCLLKAGHKEGKYKGIMIEKGSFVTTLGHISADCKLSNDKVRTALKHLKMSENITTKFNGKGLIISIKNFDDYQIIPSKSQPYPKHIPSKSQHNNNVNNVNNGDVYDISTITDTNFLRFWDVYGKHNYIMDTYRVWCEKNFDEETVKDVIHGAEEYTKENINNRKHMIFPRTFLLDEKWKDYKQVQDEQYDREKDLDDIREYLKTQGVEV